jgi:hypothetical protein
MLRWRRRSRDPVEEIIEHAVKLCQRDFPDETEKSIALGPANVLGDETFERMGSGERTVAQSKCRMGFMVRAAETQVVPEANDRDDQGWVVILEVLAKSAEQFRGREPVIAMIAAAEWFSRDLETTEALFQAVPGLSAEARRQVMERWRALDSSKLPEQDRLFIYGFASCAVREVALVSQERGDAEREGRTPNF